MNNVWWLLAGFFFGVLFVMKGLLPFAIDQFIKSNSGKTLGQEIDGEMYTVEIRKCINSKK